MQNSALADVTVDKVQGNMVMEEEDKDFKRQILVKSLCEPIKEPNYASDEEHEDGTTADKHFAQQMMLWVSGLYEGKPIFDPLY